MGSKMIKAGVMAAALAASGVSFAQVPRLPGREGTPRPAPAPPRQPDVPGAEQGARRMDERQERMLGALRQRSQQGQELGRLAQERGASGQVKDLGRKLVEDHARVERELGQLVAERGRRAEDLRGPKEERKGHDATLKRLRDLSGAEFDRTFLQQLELAQRGQREDLQRWRDETPGEDARLKKWLSDTEQVAESDLLASRNAMAAIGQPWEQDPRSGAAGRRPPAHGPRGDR
ncbi:conserved hypothetical protein [Anaeromyxobacter sp. Fw109-5]|nr:conserved hypothetical protein [Anaeromyxobacter sp. Fw109-5]